MNKKNNNNNKFENEYKVFNVHEVKANKKQIHQSIYLDSPNAIVQNICFYGEYKEDKVPAFTAGETYKITWELIENE